MNDRDGIVQDLRVEEREEHDQDLSVADDVVDGRGSAAPPPEGVRVSPVAPPVLRAGLDGGRRSGLPL